MMKMLLALGVAATLASPAFAQALAGNTSSAPAAQSGKANANGNSAERTICRRINATESRLKAEKVCMTQQQWREWERNNR